MHQFHYSEQEGHEKVYLDDKFTIISLGICGCDLNTMKWALGRACPGAY